MYFHRPSFRFIYIYNWQIKINTILVNCIKSTLYFDEGTSSTIFTHTYQLHIRLAQISDHPPSSTSLCRTRLFCSGIISLLQRKLKDDSFDHRTVPGSRTCQLGARVLAPPWRTAVAAATNGNIYQLPFQTFSSKEESTIFNSAEKSGILLFLRFNVT